VTIKIDRAEMALLELEELIAEKDFNSLPPIAEHLDVIKSVKAHSLVKEIEHAEEAVSELEDMVKQQDSSQYLIQKIQQALKSKKP
jgi:SOS-response transcriptional repressor LexA